MKTLVLTSALLLATAGTAMAGGISFTLPNLTFPPSDEVVVTKDCLDLNATTVCETDQ